MGRIWSAGGDGYAWGTVLPIDWQGWREAIEVSAASTEEQRLVTIQRDGNIVFSILEDPARNLDNQSVRLWIYNNFPNVRNWHIDGRLITDGRHKFFSDSDSDIDGHIC